MVWDSVWAYFKVFRFEMIYYPYLVVQCVMSGVTRQTLQPLSLLVEYPTTSDITHNSTLVRDGDLRCIRNCSSLNQLVRWSFISHHLTDVRPPLICLFRSILEKIIRSSLSANLYQNCKHRYFSCDLNRQR